MCILSSPSDLLATARRRVDLNFIFLITQIYQHTQRPFAYAWDILTRKQFQKYAQTFFKSKSNIFQ